MAPLGCCWWSSFYYPAEDNSATALWRHQKVTPTAHICPGPVSGASLAVTESDSRRCLFLSSGDLQGVEAARVTGIEERRKIQERRQEGIQWPLGSLVALRLSMFQDGRASAKNSNSRAECLQNIHGERFSEGERCIKLERRWKIQNNTGKSQKCTDLGCASVSCFEPTKTSLGFMEAHYWIIGHHILAQSLATLFLGGQGLNWAGDSSLLSRPWSCWSSASF